MRLTTIGRKWFRVLALSVLAFLLLALPTVEQAEAGHGSWSYWQEAYDWSSTFKARGVSRCSQGCYSEVVGIYKSGQGWTDLECVSPQNACYTQRGVWKFYSFPSWVYTDYVYCAVNPCWLSHSGSNTKAVYYP